jgi:hypothetical protein
MNIFTFSKTPWTGDKPTARPVPTQNKANTENEKKNIYTPSGIRTHDSSDYDRALYDGATVTNFKCSKFFHTLKRNRRCTNSGSYYEGGQVNHPGLRNLYT